MMLENHARVVSSNLAADVTTSANLKWERKRDMERQAEESAKREEGSGG
jgi:hypothetical protein